MLSFNLFAVILFLLDEPGSMLGSSVGSSAAVSSVGRLDLVQAANGMCCNNFYRDLLNEGIHLIKVLFRFCLFHCLGL